MEIIGLPIDDSVGGMTLMSSMSSQSKKNLVLRPNIFAWNPIILADRHSRPCRQSMAT